MRPVQLSIVQVFGMLMFLAMSFASWHAAGRYDGRLPYQLDHWLIVSAGGCLGGVVGVAIKRPGVGLAIGFSISGIVYGAYYYDYLVKFLQR